MLALASRCETAKIYDARKYEMREYKFDGPNRISVGVMIFRN